MSYRKRTLLEHFERDGSPKRILALDGGGVRGILTLGMLERVEAVLRKRYGDADDFRLSDYFDLIAGTSTGAIIAAGLAMGMQVKYLKQKYMQLAGSVFERSLFRLGFLRARYSKDKLTDELKNLLGEGATLGSEAILTGLLIMTKRLDTGSPWPISNNPRGKYYQDREGGVIGNGRYPLWQVVRASAAAPHYFEPEKIDISSSGVGNVVSGDFVDGGISPFNNPSLQALMYATIDGYNMRWPLGRDKLFLLSLGTGMISADVSSSWIAAEHTVKSLLALMLDCADLQETMLQWMSQSPTARRIDSEMGDLDRDLICGSPALTYLRYDVELSEDVVLGLTPDISRDRVKELCSMDDPGNMSELYALGVAKATSAIGEDLFSEQFDL